MVFKTSVTATEAHVVQQGHTSKALQNSVYCGQTVQMLKAFRENLIQTITLTKPTLIDGKFPSGFELLSTSTLDT